MGEVNTTRPEISTIENFEKLAGGKVTVNPALAGLGNTWTSVSVSLSPVMMLLPFSTRTYVTDRAGDPDAVTYCARIRD